MPTLRGILLATSDRTRNDNHNQADHHQMTRFDHHRPTMGRIMPDVIMVMKRLLRTERRDSNSHLAPSIDDRSRTIPPSGSINHAVALDENPTGRRRRRPLRPIGPPTSSRDQVMGSQALDRQRQGIRPGTSFMTEATVEGTMAVTIATRANEIMVVSSLLCRYDKTMVSLMAAAAAVVDGVMTRVVVMEVEVDTTIARKGATLENKLMWDQNRRHSRTSIDRREDDSLTVRSSADYRTILQSPGDGWSVATMCDQ